MHQQPSITVFRDTIRNLCSNSSYLFWAGIRNISQSACFYANFTFVAETISGQVIKSFQTGDIGGASDKGSPYFGYLAPDARISFPEYYGGIFSLPAGATDVILKIVTNSTNANSSCTNTFAMDNILLTPVGPALDIANKDTDGWITGTCFNNGAPIALKGGFSSAITSSVQEILYMLNLIIRLINGSKALMMDTRGQIFPEKRILIFHAFFLLQILFI